MTVRVEYLDDEPNGLAAMMGGLIEANLVHGLATHPALVSRLNRLLSVSGPRAG